MAQILFERRVDAWFSYAGRTQSPKPQPIPTRTGGFGGVQGMTNWLQKNAISHVIDATHPFATVISDNTVQACKRAGVALCALERPRWQASARDRWQQVPDIQAAAHALPHKASRIFLAIGKQHLDAFAEHEQHHYLLRLVDPPLDSLPLASTTAVIARGPFTEDQDLALLRQHSIQWVVARNSGGSGARSKLDAAANLQLPVIMIDRPRLPARAVVHTPTDVLTWLAHATARGV